MWHRLQIKSNDPKIWSSSILWSKSEMRCNENSFPCFFFHPFQIELKHWIELCQQNSPIYCMAQMICCATSVSSTWIRIQYFSVHTQCCAAFCLFADLPFDFGRFSKIMNIVAMAKVSTPQSAAGAVSIGCFQACRFNASAAISLTCHW